MPAIKISRKDVVLAFVFLLNSIWLYLRTIARHDFYWNDWSYSEWLINYSTGFTSRGLVGQLLHHFNTGQNSVQAVHLVIFCVSTLSNIFFITLFRLQKRLPTSAAVLAFALPGFAWQSYAAMQFITRKDDLVILPLALSAIFYLYRRNSGKSGSFKLLPHLLLFLFGAIISLAHENYFFMAFPGQVLLLFLDLKGSKGLTPRAQRRRLLFAALPAVLAWIVFLTVSLHSDREKGQHMWNSLSLGDRELLVPHGEDISRARLAFWMPSWGNRKPLNLASIALLHLVRGEPGIWVGPAVVFLLSLFGWLQLATSLQSSREQRLANLRIFLIFLIAASPVFIMTDDWGRWMALVGKATVIVWVATLGSDLSAVSLPRKLPLILQEFSLVSLRIPQGFVVAFLLFRLSFLSFPECCVEYGFHSTLLNPIYEPLKTSVINTMFGGREDF